MYIERRTRKCGEKFLTWTIRWSERITPGSVGDLCCRCCRSDLSGAEVHLGGKSQWSDRSSCYGADSVKLRNHPDRIPVWDTVWNYVVPLSLPLLLMQCNVRDMGKDSLRLLGIFLCGSVGTMVGALIGFAVLGNFIPELNALAGVFTGTYIGGSVNFAALGEAFGVTGEMLSAATVADNLLMALYFFVLVMIPGINFFRKHYKHPHQDAVEAGTADKDSEGTAAAAYWGRKEISLKDIALAVAVAFVIVAVSSIVADFLAGVIPTSNPVLSMLNTLFGNMYLWIATISMICATAAPGFFGEIRGTNEMGTFLIYLFFFVIGVPASIPLIVRNSPLLLVFAAIVVIVNMLFSLVLEKSSSLTWRKSCVHLMQTSADLPLQLLWQFPRAGQNWLDLV